MGISLAASTKQNFKTMTRLKVIPGKDLENDPKNPDDVTPIKFKIQDDRSVAGFGMPITMRLCRKIVHDYHLMQVKAGVNADAEIVSGVYGRETIMNILEQEGCEGIRYITCLYGGEKSIVLLGVDNKGEPIGGKARFLEDREPEDGSAVLFEVKGGGKSWAEINSLIPEDAAEDESKKIIFQSIL